MWRERERDREILAKVQLFGNRAVVYTEEVHVPQLRAFEAALRVFVYIYIYIYMCIQREGERRITYIHMYTCTYIHIVNNI